MLNSAKIIGVRRSWWSISCSEEEEWRLILSYSRPPFTHSNDTKDARRHDTHTYTLLLAGHERI